MNKSLLRILKTEDDILCGIACCERLIPVYRMELDRTLEYPYNCESRDNDIRFFEDQIAYESKRLAKYKAELESTRSEMRDYFAMLFGKGGENDG